MLPVIFSVGNLSVSSFGFFLALAFLYGTFLVWRLARAWDLNEEKILDLSLLTFFGGLIGARLFFVLEHIDFFLIDLSKVALFIQYPGFSFWGAFLGGWLTLHFFSKRLKMPLSSTLDIAAIGVLGGLIVGSIGCFLGACGVGKVSDVFFAVDMVGFVGKRFPVQLIEVFLLFVVFLKMWPKAIQFHPPGRIVSLVLIFVGLVKLFSQFFKDVNLIDYTLSFAVIVLGTTLFYSFGKRSFKEDLKMLFKLSVKFFTDNGTRKMLLLILWKNLRTSWYNIKIGFIWKIRNTNKFLRRMNVRSHPKNTRNY